MLSLFYIRFLRYIRLHYDSLCILAEQILRYGSPREFVRILRGDPTGNRTRIAELRILCPNR